MAALVRVLLRAVLLLGLSAQVYGQGVTYGGAVFGAVLYSQTAPSDPTITSVTTGDEQATVEFSPPTDTGGGVVTGYTVTASPGGATASCTASPCTVTGLTNGTSYTFTVSATNAVGTGSSSSPSDPIIPNPVASTPQPIPALPLLGVILLLALMMGLGMTSSTAPFALDRLRPTQ